MMVLLIIVHNSSDNFTKGFCNNMSDTSDITVPKVCLKGESVSDEENRAQIDVIILIKDTKLKN